MEIRLANPNDRDQLRWLWSYCFDDLPAFVDWFFQDVFEPDNTLCAAEGASILSAIQMIPRRMFVRGGCVRTGYIVGVSTLPEHRGRGLAGALLRSGLELMKSRGQLLSILVPFDFRFYRRFGWEATHYLHRIEARPEVLGHVRDARGILPVGESDWEQLDAVYEQFCRPRHGYLMRDEGEWRRIFKDLALDGGLAYGVGDGNGGLAGYILFRMAGRSLEIRELAYRSPGAKRSLLGFVAGHSAQADGAVWNAPLDADADSLCTIPGMRVSLSPFMMSRPTDLPALLSACRFDPSVRGEINMAVSSDGEAPGQYRLSIREGIPGLEEGPPGEADLAAPLGTWTRLILGSTTPSRAVRAGELDVYAPRALALADAVFTPQCNFADELF